MFNTRRCFLKNLAGVSSSFLLLQSSPPIPEPRHRMPVDPPPPAEPQDTDNPSDISRDMQRVRLQAQEKQFRENYVSALCKSERPESPSRCATSSRCFFGHRLQANPRNRKASQTTKKLRQALTWSAAVLLPLSQGEHEAQMQR